jgi:hypothetical protein
MVCKILINLGRRDIYFANGVQIRCTLDLCSKDGHMARQLRCPSNSVLDAEFL